MNHMDGLVSQADAQRSAAESKLTVEEAHALRIAAGFRVASWQERNDTYSALQSASRKLKAIELGGGQ